MYPITNTGTGNPKTEKAMTARSIHVPAFHAATTPMGTANGDGHDQRDEHQGKRGLDALRDERRHGQVGEDRDPEIEVRQAPELSRVRGSIRPKAACRILGLRGVA